MTLEGSVADVTPVVSPDRAEHDILGIMFEFLVKSERRSWSGSHCAVM